MKKLQRLYLPLLILSLAVNVLLYDLWQEAKMQAQSHKEVAQRCSKSVEKLREAGDVQIKENAQALEDAKKRALDAEQRARRELTRSPAVPGNACASARVENREWLEGRRAGK